MKTMNLLRNHKIKAMMTMTIMAAFILPMLFPGKGDIAAIHAAVKTSSYLSGEEAIKSGKRIYYKLDKKLCQYDIKTKKIKKLHKFSAGIDKLYKYHSNIYVQTRKATKKNGRYIRKYTIYRYGTTTRKVKAMEKNAVFLGMIGENVYCVKIKDKKLDILRLKNNGTKTVVFKDLGSTSYVDYYLHDLCYIWNEKLYYKQTEKQDAVTTDTTNNSEEDDDEEEDKNASYHYLTADGTVHDITKNKYNKILYKYVVALWYPEKGVSNMGFSLTQIQYGKKSYSYYSNLMDGWSTSKKATLIRHNQKNNKERVIYSIKKKTKKAKYRWINDTPAVFKKQILVEEDMTYKKKKRGYKGEYTYRLLNAKGKVIKTLGKVKYKRR